MQVEVSGVECDDREYPFLGVCGEVVVLFHVNGVGTVVSDDSDDYDVGYHSAEWDMDMFDAFSGVVRLANDDVDMSASGSNARTTKRAAFSAVEKWSSRFVHTEKIAGSNPARATKISIERCKTDTTDFARDVLCLNGE